MTPKHAPQLSVYFSHLLEVDNVLWRKIQLELVKPFYGFRTFKICLPYRLGVYMWPPDNGIALCFDSWYTGHLTKTHIDAHNPWTIYFSCGQYLLTGQSYIYAGLAEFSQNGVEPHTRDLYIKQQRKRSVCMVVHDQISLTRLHIQRSQAISQEVVASSISLNQFWSLE